MIGLRQLVQRGRSLFPDASVVVQKLFLLRIGLLRRVALFARLSEFLFQFLEIRITQILRLFRQRRNPLRSIGAVVPIGVDALPLLREPFFAIGVADGRERSHERVLIVKSVRRKR